ncbi:MAG TPA: DNA alkylation repair protein [Bacteroidales bacterium]|nr:DNA alkylation repair protein [Bacteroidales bacterium]
MNANNVKEHLLGLADPIRATHSLRFFKTGKGQYGEGDKFIGCTVPQTRSVAAKCFKLPLDEVAHLLKDEIHECRLCALVILTNKYDKANELERYEILNFYLAHTNYINNWDLVDISAHKIVGEWFKNRTDRSIIYQLADSHMLWNQRIAIVSTFTFIRNNDFNDTLRLSEKFLGHKHDLIHKACGWMLREVGKRDQLVLTYFLDQFAHQMPRTMLRYSIEKFDEDLRKHYLNIKK